jgi:hypothetical protein
MVFREVATVDDIPIAFPISSYQWESHLDASLPEGASAFVPSPWLLMELGLSLDPSDFSICRDASGEVLFIASKGGQAGSSAVINEEMFSAYLDRQALDCVWLFVTERGVWPGGDNDNAAWRRTEGVCWIENGKPTTVTWKEDRVNKRNA